jgi:hypothetical protein
MRVIKIAISSKAQKLRTRGLRTRQGNETRATDKHPRGLRPLAG